MIPAGQHACPVSLVLTTPPLVLGSLPGTQQAVVPSRALRRGRLHGAEFPSTGSTWIPSGGLVSTVRFLGAGGTTSSGRHLELQAAGSMGGTLRSGASAPGLRLSCSLRPRDAASTTGHSPPHQPCTVQAQPTGTSADGHLCPWRQCLSLSCLHAPVGPGDSFSATTCPSLHITLKAHHSSLCQELCSVPPCRQKDWPQVHRPGSLGPASPLGHAVPVCSHPGSSDVP
ncbi:hypothetical protein GHT09_013420 [Marmota monax]|uniref:Uncharacterized protein n=1 Tax=Marmota monax TaxID=9995 RepID=A0A834PLE8_MARMO|nr:hypothetical protein GHT09_013420 [Marmota monax]